MPDRPGWEEKINFKTAVVTSRLKKFRDKESARRLGRWLISKEVETETVTKHASRKAWARLLAKVYEIDVLCCPRRDGRISGIAIIRDPASIRKIIACLETKGREPP
jgi:hypothetical protein